MSTASERDCLGELLRNVTLNKSPHDGSMPRLAFMGMLANANSYLEVLEDVTAYYAGTWQLHDGKPLGGAGS